jgi:hypothetical protein
MAASQDQISLEPNTRTNENGFEEYGWIPSYTQLLMVFNSTCRNQSVNLYVLINSLSL